MTMITCLMPAEVLQKKKLQKNLLSIRNNSSVTMAKSFNDDYYYYVLGDAPSIAVAVPFIAGLTRKLTNPICL